MQSFVLTDIFFAINGLDSSWNSTWCFFILHYVFLHLFLHGVLFLLEIGGWCFVGISSRGGFFTWSSLVSRIDSGFVRFGTSSYQFVF